MNKRRRIASLPIFVILLACLFVLPGLANSSVLSETHADGDMPQVAATLATPTMCPQATPEAFWVDPVVSPTGALTQTILVYIGKGDWARVSLETGVFTKTDTINLLNPAEVVVDLNPDTVHHLTASAHVPVVPGPGGCMYGGYTLSTSFDRNGNPLTIVQLNNRNYFPLVESNQPD